MQTPRRMLLYCGVACVNILSTLLPVWPIRYELLAHWLPTPLIQGAQFATLYLGVSMLLLAAPVAEGHRKAARLLMLCTGLAICANILKGLDVEEAAINGVLLVILWRGRKRFHALPLRYTLVDVCRLGIALLIFLWLYNLTGNALLRALRSMVYRGQSDFPQVDRLADVLTAKLELQHLWFHESQLVLPVFVVLIFLAYSWRSVIHIRSPYDGPDDLYARFGRASHNSLAYLARRSDVLRFVDTEAQGAITYRQIGRVALQIGAILAPPEQREAVYRDFLAFCRSQHLIPAAAALAEEERAVVRNCGMRTLNIGTEAVVELGNFSVEQLGKKMRWAQRSLGKRGYTMTLLSAATIPAQKRVALDHIDDEWRETRGGQSHGCCMTLGRFPTRSDADCLIAIAQDENERPVAYLTLLPGGIGYHSLDLTRRLHHAPNAIIEFLLLEVLEELKRCGTTHVSLNFSTCSSLSSLPALSRAMALAGKVIQLGSLEAFNAKFKPRWAPRYLVFPSWYHVPDIAYTVLVLEGVDRMLINATMRGLRKWLVRYKKEEQFAPHLQSKQVQ